MDAYQDQTPIQGEDGDDRNYVMMFFSQETIDLESNKQKNEIRLQREKEKRLEEERKKLETQKNEQDKQTEARKREELRRINEEKARLDKLKKDQEAKELDVIVN